MVRLIYFVYYFLSVSALAFSIFLIGKKGVSITVSMDYFADRNFGNNSYDFHNEKKISISEDRRINSTVRWGIRFMLVNKMLLNVIAILLVIFAIFLFSYYFSMFFTRRKKKIAIVIGYIIFVVWQLLLLNASTLPVYINIIITIVITFISVMCIYEGRGWNKCIFVLAFNAIWMMIETVQFPRNHMIYINMAFRLDLRCYAVALHIKEAPVARLMIRPWKVISRQSASVKQQI